MNTKLDRLIRDTQIEEGWTDATLLIVLIDLISEKLPEKVVAEFLEEATDTDI